MPKDFNELLGNDYEFTVREQTFSFRDLSPREAAKVDAILMSTNGKKGEERQSWDLFADQIEQFLPQEQRQRWRELYEREEEPITLGQLMAIRNWLVEVQAGDRPTKGPSTSSPGRGRTAPSSKGA